MTDGTDRVLLASDARPFSLDTLSQPWLHPLQPAVVQLGVLVVV